MNRDGREELLSIEGTVEKLIYQNEENGYTVCELMAPSDECFVLVGMMPYLCEGESISALGSWTTHPSFGRQFKVEFYEKQLPATATAILKYLSSGAIKGIGPMTAKKSWSNTATTRLTCWSIIRSGFRMSPAFPAGRRRKSAKFSAHSSECGMSCCFAANI